MDTIKKSFADLFHEVPKYQLTAALIRGAIAAAIINKRHSLGITQKEFAKRCHVTQGMVSKWESADYNFTISSLTELMTELRISIDLLLDGESATNQNYQSYSDSVPDEGWGILTPITSAANKTEGAA